MDSSMQFVRPCKGSQHYPVVPGSPGAPDLKGMWVAICQRRYPARASGPRVEVSPTTASESAPNESSANYPMPGYPDVLAYGGREPLIVRFIDGGASPARRVILVEMMHQLGPWPGQTLLVKNSPGELECRLERARNWAEDYLAYHHQRPVIGIDGIDQWLTSPGSCSAQLQTLLHAGAHVVCAADSRYRDFNLLVLDLCIRGILVWCDKRVPTTPLRLSPVPDMPRFPDVSVGATQPENPDQVLPPIEPRYRPRRRNPGMHAVQGWPSASPALTPSWPRYDVPDCLFSADEREMNIREYRNAFAIRRILRERFGF